MESSSKKIVFITTTIKRKYMDQILSGIKTVEYKGYTDFWSTRINRVLHNPVYPDNCVINFLCGQKAYKYKITKIELQVGPREIDGAKYDKYYEIHFEEMPEGQLL